MEFKVEVDENMYGISKCPFRTYEDIYLGGYFCWKMCKYHRGIDRENRIVKCDFPIEEESLSDVPAKNLAEACWVVQDTVEGSGVRLKERNND